MSDLATLQKQELQRLQQTIKQGVLLHSSGNLAGAEKIYRQILESIPVQYDALHLLGIVRQQQGRLEEARELIEKALKSHPESAEAHCNLGGVLHALGRREEAIESFERSLACNPKDAEVHYNRATVLAELGRNEEALESYERALALHPNSPRTLYNRGCVLKELDRFEEALASYDRARTFLPQNVDILNNRGNVLAELGRHEEALADYEQALAVEPRNAEVLCNCGNALAKLKRYDEAAARYAAAKAAKPGHAEPYVNLGQMLLACNRPLEAVEEYERALAIDPNHALAHVHYANALETLGRHQEALERHDIALAGQSGLVEAEWNKSLIHLSLGEFAEGWPLYERRWAVNKGNPRLYAQPRWSGERVAGVLLAWGEQGLGDQILYASMVPELPARADSVVVEVEPRLVPLFRRSFAGIEVRALAPELYAGRVDAHAAFGDLGRFLRRGFADFPRRAGGYLAADRAAAARLRERLGKERAVGLSWRSINPAVGELKTARLGEFAPLLRLPGVRGVDLQYGDTAAERGAVEAEIGARVLHLDEVDNTQDIDALAALIAACDAVVTVSNTTAHLAGALGKPTWVLVPHGYMRVWYWFSDRADSPWYPQLQVRRQAMGQPWSELIASVSEEVARFLQTN